MKPDHSKSRLFLLLFSIQHLAFSLSASADPPTTTQTPVTPTTGTAAYALHSGTATAVSGPINGAQLQTQTVQPGSLTNSLGAPGALTIGNGGISFGAQGLVTGFTPSTNLALASGTYPSLVSGSASYSTTGGTAMDLSAGIQPAAWATNGIVYISATGNDATGVRNDIAHPYLTGTAAYAVAQPYDVIQTGSGVWGAPGYPAWLPSTISIPLWVKGAGSGEYASNYSQIIGGTRVYGSWLRNSGTNFINGFRVTDLAQDNGSVLSGGTNVGANGMVFDAINDFWVSNVKCLGNGPGTSDELVVVSGGTNGTIDHTSYALGGQPLVIKSSYVRVHDLWGWASYAETIVLKDGGRGSPGITGSNNMAVHVSLDDINISGANSGAGDIWIDETNLSNSTPTVGADTLNNIHTTCGIYISHSGTMAPLSGIEINNWTDDSSVSGAVDAINETGNYAEPIYASVSNSEITGGARIVCNQPFTFTNCRVVGASAGYELGITNTDTYADFIGCTAANCGTVIQADTVGTYLLRHPIVITGTYTWGSVIHPNASGANVMGWPRLYNYGITDSSLNSISNSGYYQYSLFNNPPLIPTCCWHQHLIETIEGTYTAASGTNTMYFGPFVGGNHPNGNIDFAVTLTGTSAGNFKLVREFFDRDRTSNHSTSYGNWWCTLYIGGQTYYVYSTYFNIPANTDQTLNESVCWNPASSSNSITPIKASVEIVDDPVDGY